MANSHGPGLSCCASATGIIAVWASSSCFYLAIPSPGAKDMQDTSDLEKITKYMLLMPGFSGLEYYQPEEAKICTLQEFFDSLVRPGLGWPSSEDWFIRV